MQKGADSTPVQELNPLGTAKIQSLMLKFSVPAIISFLVNAIYNMVDQIFIGNAIGEAGTAATNIAFPLVTIGTALSLLIGVGGASNFNLKLGAKRPEDAGKIAGNAISASVIAGLLLCVISIAFLNPLLWLFGATEQTMEYASIYTFIVVLGFPFMVFNTAAGNLIRADGSPRYAMVAMLAGAVFNLIFDPIFMHTFGMGIAGIALATSLGQVLSSAISLYYFLRKFQSVPLKREALRPEGKYLKQIAALGAAASINQVAMAAVQIVLNNVLRHYGELSVYGSTIPIAVVGLVSKVNIIFLGFTLGISQGCQPIVGYNYGAKNYRRVKDTYRMALTAATVVSVISFLAFQLFPRQLISIFGDGGELYYQFAERYFRIFMMMTLINGIQPVTANFFTSIGKAKVGMLISLTRQVLFLLPLIVILPIFLGIDGVVYAGPVADAAAAIVAAVLILREMKNMAALEAADGLYQQV